MKEGYENMLETKEVIDIIRQHQEEDDNAYKLLSLCYDDSITAVYRARKAARNKIIEALGGETTAIC